MVMECKVWITLGGDHGVEIIWRSPRPGVKKHGIDFFGKKKNQRDQQSRC